MAEDIRRAMPSGLGYAPAATIRAAGRWVQPQTVVGAAKPKHRIAGPAGFWTGPGLIPVRGKARRKNVMIVPFLRAPPKPKR